MSLFVSARLNNRFGARAVLLAGLVLLAAAMGWLTRVPVEADYVTDLLPVMLLIAGGGLVLPALTNLGMSGRPRGRRRAGLGPVQHHAADRHGPRRGGAVDAGGGRTEDLLGAGRPGPPR